MAKRDVEVEFSLIDGVSKGLAKINTSLGGVTDSLASLKKTAAAAAVSFVALKVGQGLVEGVKAAGDFEAALRDVQAVSGATADQMDALKKAAVDGAKASGLSFEETAAGLGELARATGDADKAIAALPATLALARGGGLAVAEAATILTTTLTQFGLAANEATTVADVLAQAANSTSSNVQQLGLSLSYAAPLARQLGIGLEPTVAIIGALADQGFRGERAGTALRNVFSQLADPASKFSEALKTAGIESRDFTTVIGELSKRADGGKKVLLALDSEARPAIIALARDGGAAINKLSKDLEGAGGSAQKTADIINSGFNASFGKLKTQLAEIGDLLLSPLLGPLAAELDDLKVSIEEFATSDEFKAFAVDLKEAFESGLVAVREFVQGLDFDQALSQLKNFVNEAETTFKALSAIATETATAVNLTARALELLTDPVAAASRATEDLADSFGYTADEAEAAGSKIESAKEGIRKVGESATRSAGEVKKLGDEIKALPSAAAQVQSSLTAAVESIKSVGTAARATSDEEREIIATTEALAKVQAQAYLEVDKTNLAFAAAGISIAKTKTEFELLTEGMTPLQAELLRVKLGLDELGNVKPIEGLSKAQAKARTQFQDTQAEIKASIDATKQFASSASEAADAVDDISTAAEGARDTLDEALSGAIFQGLSEGIARVSSAMSLLEGVSETAIRDKLQGNLRGAINEFKGLNDQIVKYDAFLRSAAGAEQLARANRELERRNELLATATQRAKEAAQAQRDLTATLQDQADARNLTEGEQEARRYQEQLRQIEELARTRGRLGAMDAEKQRQLAAAEHEARLAEIRAEQSERVRATEEADDAIAGRRRGQGVVFAAGEAQASEAQTAATQSIVINVNALDLRNAPDFVDRLDSELRRKAKASL